MILDHVFNGQMSVDRLEVIGQPIVGAAKIVALVLKTGAEIPLAGDEKAMVVTEIVIKRIALAESRFVFEIAAQRINRFEGKDIERSFVPCFCRLLHFRFGSREYAGAGKNRKNPRNK